LFLGVLCRELLLVLVQCCAYGTENIEEQTTTLQFGVGEGRITIYFYNRKKKYVGVRRFHFLDSPVQIQKSKAIQIMLS